MPLPSRFLRMLRDGRLPVGTRLDLARAELRRRLRPRASYPVRLGPSTVHLSDDDYDVDWKSLAFVLVDAPYATGYEGAVVLDLGAHKGYYGAYALAGGASAVTSFEPERANLELLGRTAGSHRASGRTWHVRPTAVGARAGETDLHVMDASWGHAINPPERFAEYEVGTQRIRVEALADVLAEAGTAKPAGAPLVVKVNVEGEECDAVLGTPPSAWEVVDEVFVETHPWASCGAAELETHLSQAGLRRAASAHPLVLRMRRAPDAPDAPRTDPT